MNDFVEKVADSYSKRPHRCYGGVGLGVWWYVWGIKGFWWGLLYGAFWPAWLGYRLAAMLLPS